MEKDSEKSRSARPLNELRGKRGGKRVVKSLIIERRPAGLSLAKFGRDEQGLI